MTEAHAEAAQATREALLSIELLDRDEACQFFGGCARPINAATLYRGIKDGRYPAPIKVGANSSRWIKSECEKALAAIIAARPVRAAA